MKKDLTLLIMAAGMGSRFGGLKQIEPVGPNDEFIIDYSVYDAVRTGFKKIVFVIKEENYEIFKSTIGSRIEDKIKVEYCFQKDSFEYNGKIYKRNKPWGTAHAIMSSRNNIDGDFVVINSDDFYGYDAYLEASSFFDKKRDEKEMGMVTYKVNNTLTENGSVKRGVCVIEDGKLKNIIESIIEKTENKIIAKPLNGDSEFEIEADRPVSMNVLLFNKNIFDIIDNYMDKFVKRVDENFEKEEFLIPDVIKDGIKDNLISVDTINTTAKWEGVTYKEDKKEVVDAIRKLINDGEYKYNLWEE